MFRGVQQASENAAEQQQQLLRQMLTGGDMPTIDMNQLGALRQTATFKTRVQSGGRISIPDAEREALGINEDDLVQAIVFPVTTTNSE
ncbi:AbrB/MazE/SpoVT family DNA-binding domain-containing protein [Haloarcula sp. JP-L23]|uniref:AbrB/MazE/SpoVT family DNA-binding domain-containing protein n=1 Tax=Haloarcula sp. JP-L23 TaxID=2716717 RepID=UPI00140F3E60|nr:AbrB/MazE/SpoVT family DNA-binding domain-containing protein [Haloarcula sp. JP-L23]